MKLTLTRVLLLTVTLMISAAQANPILEMSPADEVKFNQTMHFVSAGGRGFITGYKKGMYKLKRYSIDPQCFDNKTQETLISTFSKWGTS